MIFKYRNLFIKMTNQTQPEFPNSKLLERITAHCPVCDRLTVWEYQNRVTLENQDYDLYICEGCNVTRTLQTIVNRGIRK